MLRLRTAQHFTAYLGGADMKALLDGVLPRLDLTNKEDMDLYTDSKKRAKDWIRSWKSQLSGYSRRFFAHWLETNPEYENCYRFDDLKAALIRTYQEHWPGQVFRSTMRFIDSESITPRGKKWLNVSFPLVATDAGLGIFLSNADWLLADLTFSFVTRSAAIGGLRARRVRVRCHNGSENTTARRFVSCFQLSFSIRC